MLQAYSHFSGTKELDDLDLPDYYIHVLCMYNFIALQHGVDPEDTSSGTNVTSQPKEKPRKVGGVEAARLLIELSQIKAQGEKK